MTEAGGRIDDILRFWFGDLPAHDAPPPSDKVEAWFKSDPAFDERIRSEFEPDVQRALGGELDDWAATPRGTLALVILLDQFTRNIYRRTPKAHKGDRRALEIARAAMAAGQDEPLHPAERAFLYMPLMHAEDPDVQERSVEVFRALEAVAPEPLRPLCANFHHHAKLHRDEVARFGRFPARNTYLDRTTTPDELAFLKRR
jgi:uncharacterized protein (DUF924 family)